MFAKSNAGPLIYCVCLSLKGREVPPSEHRLVAHIVFLDRTVLPIEALWVREDDLTINLEIQK